MNLKNRLKKLEEMEFTVDQEDKIISFFKCGRSVYFRGIKRCCEC